MKIETLAAALVVTAILASPAAATAQEKKLTHSQLPPAVQRTADEQSKGATVHGYTTEKDDGQTVYEVEMTVHGRSRDVTIDSTGTVLEMEEQVVFDSLPEAVRTGLRQAAGSGVITKVESLSKLGRLVAYEAQVHLGAKRSEVQVGPDGKPLAYPQ